LQSQLYAVTNYNHNNKSNINIYSLAYPPLKIEDTLQTVAGHKALVTKTGFFIGIGICIIAGMGCMYLCYRKKKRRRKESHIPHNPPVVTNTDRSSKTTTQDENYKPQPDIHKKSSFLRWISSMG
jgi:H+/gluconate symporter-like permease